MDHFEGEWEGEQNKCKIGLVGVVDLGNKTEN